MPLELVTASPEEQAAFDVLEASADHYQIADHFLRTLQRQADDVAPVFCLGMFWVFNPDSGLWAQRPMDAIAAAIGAEYQNLKLCKRGTDYKQIAALAACIAADDGFFSAAPSGIAADRQFWTVSPAGDIECQTLSHAQRQRVKAAAAPAFDARAPLFEKLLDNALGIGESGQAQRELLQMAMGAAMTQQLWRYRVVLMLYGATSTGKSTLLEVFKSYFPADVIGATSPSKWENEYYVASLARKLLNLVGELDPHTPISGGPFKSVTGGDVVEGRDPTHKPFSFVCTASHIWNANRLPPTRDKSDAFFRRVRIVEFKNPVAVGKEIIGLAQRIVAEEHGAVLGWLLEGAARLAQRGSLPETDEHTRLVNYWRAANNSALQFLLDPEYCVADQSPDHKLKAADVFEAYRRWASETGLKPLGRNGFYEAAEDGAGRFGMRIYDDPKSNTKQFSGVSLKK
jgi:putative DNA primase/helicase